MNPPVIASLRLLLLALFCLVSSSCGPEVRPLQERSGDRPPELEVLVVDLAGVLGTVEIAYCHRALREADGRRLVFRLRDAGGMAESAAQTLGLLDQLAEARDRGVLTTAVVQGQVTGGAAFLALLCDELYFMRGGQLGSVTPMASTWEMIQEMSDEDAERVRYRQYAEEMLQRLGLRREKLSQNAVRLCEGMADPALRLVRATIARGGLESVRIVSAEELAGLAQGGAEVLAQSEVTQPVMLTAAEAVDVGISRGVVDSMEQLCSDILLVDRRLVGELQVSWSEQMVGWLEWMQPALLVLGFVLLVLELKTPGLGVAGLLGTLFLSLGMFYSYLVGLADVAEIVLFFLGIALLAVEIFMLPGMVVFGAFGFVCLVLSLVLSRQTFVLPQTGTQEDILFHNLLQLMLLFLGVIVAAALLWRTLPYIPILRRVYLPAAEPATGSGVRAPASGSRPAGWRLGLVGQIGRTLTVLRPSGVAEIAGQPVDVVTEGDYVPAGQQVRVLEVVGNRVVVEAAASSPGTSEDGSVGVILLLMVLALVFFVGEVFFISFGVLSALGIGSVFGAVFLAFQEGDAWGWIVLSSEAVLAPLAIWGAMRVMPHTRFGRALMLAAPSRDEVAGRATEPGLQGLMGHVGETLSSLRPSGFARIDGRKVDVTTRGEMIDQGVAVRVIEVLGNRVVVRGDRSHSGGPES